MEVEAMTPEHSNELLRDTHDAVIRIETRCKGCSTAITALQKTTYGNGTTGLTTKVYAIMGLLAFVSMVLGGVVISLLADHFSGS